MDHTLNTFPVANTSYHIPNIPWEEAHMYANQGASMVAQHKSLSDGTGSGMGWILANSIRKAQFVMQQQQEFARLHKQQKPYQSQNPHQQQYPGWGQNTQQKHP